MIQTQAYLEEIESKHKENMDLGLVHFKSLEKEQSFEKGQRREQTHRTEGPSFWY